jgi:hypothetical protein
MRIEPGLTHFTSVFISNLFLDNLSVCDAASFDVGRTVVKRTFVSVEIHLVTDACGART